MHSIRLDTHAYEKDGDYRYDHAPHLAEFSVERERKGNASFLSILIRHFRRTSHFSASRSAPVGTMNDRRRSEIQFRDANDLPKVQLNDECESIVPLVYEVRRGRVGDLT